MTTQPTDTTDTTTEPTTTVVGYVDLTTCSTPYPGSVAVPCEPVLDAPQPGNGTTDLITLGDCTDPTLTLGETCATSPAPEFYPCTSTDVIVQVGPPPTLPATGAGETVALGGIAAVLLVVGIGAARISSRGNRRP